MLSEMKQNSWEETLHIDHIDNNLKRHKLNNIIISKKIKDKYKRYCVKCLIIIFLK